MRSLLPKLQVDLAALREGRLFEPGREFGWRSASAGLSICWPERRKALKSASSAASLSSMASPNCWRAIEAQGLQNIRVHGDDATALIAAAPDGCFSRIYLLYPDPWPKRRQQKRRFVSERNDRGPGAGAAARRRTALRHRHRRLRGLDAAPLSRFAIVCLGRENGRRLAPAVGRLVVDALRDQSARRRSRLRLPDVQAAVARLSGSASGRSGCCGWPRWPAGP